MSRHGAGRRVLGAGREGAGFAGTHGTAERAAGARGAGGARGRGAWHKRWARGLGVLLGYGLCTWCIQPVFDPI